MWYHQKLVSPWNRDILSKYPRLFIWLEVEGFECE